MPKICGTKILAVLLDATDMSAMREKDQADFDLERFIDMFDTALTSNDPRVVETLRKLLMIVALTRPETDNSGIHDRNAGPLRRLYDEVHTLNRRLHRVEEDLAQDRRMAQRNWEQKAYQWEDHEKYTMESARQVAAKMDQDIINKLKATARAKGLLDK